MEEFRNFVRSEILAEGMPTPLRSIIIDQDHNVSQQVVMVQARPGLVISGDY